MENKRFKKLNDVDHYGPPIWLLIHKFAVNYSVTDEEEPYCAMIHLLAKNFPCCVCRNHFIELLKLHPVEKATQDKTTLFKWGVDIHNSVNRSIHKPNMSYEKAESVFNEPRIDSHAIDNAIFTILFAFSSAFCSNEDLNELLEATMWMLPVHIHLKYSEAILNNKFNYVNDDGFKWIYNIYKHIVPHPKKYKDVAEFFHRSH